LTYTDMGRKSVSWTRRGHTAACCRVLHQLWEWHLQNTGASPPWDLQEMAAMSESLDEG